MGSKAPYHYINLPLRVDGVIEYSDGNGGFIDIDLVLGMRRVVADTTVRDAIPAEKRVVGMKVFVVSEQVSYTLVGGIDNANWKRVTEIEEISETLANAGADNIIVGDTTKDKVLFIDYSITRGSIIEVGRIALTNKADTYLNRQGLSSDDAGFVLSKNISGNNIRIGWQDMISDGNASTLVMSINKQII